MFDWETLKYIDETDDLTYDTGNCITYFICYKCGMYANLTFINDTNMPCEYNFCPYCGREIIKF